MCYGIYPHTQVHKELGDGNTAQHMLGMCQALGPRSNEANKHTHKHTLIFRETQTKDTWCRLREEAAPEVPPVLIYTHAHGMQVLNV